MAAINVRGVDFYYRELGSGAPVMLVHGAAGNADVWSSIFELLGVTRCIPSHWGTFPLLTGTPSALRELAPDVDIIDVEPGRTIEL